MEARRLDWKAGELLKMPCLKARSRLAECPTMESNMSVQAVLAE